MPSRISTEQAAQAWCKPETEHLNMIPELALIFAGMLDKAYQDGGRDAVSGMRLDSIMQNAETNLTFMEEYTNAQY